MLSTALLQGKNRLPNTVASDWLCRATCWKPTQLFFKWWQSLKVALKDLSNWKQGLFVALRNAIGSGFQLPHLSPLYLGIKTLRNFFGLDTCYPLWQPLAPCGCWALKMWLVQLKWAASVKYILDFKDCTKKQKRTWNRSLIILYWLHIEVIFCI